ncbi:MAG: patatin-like phospholipase family protein [Aquisalimonadaceae bacterium]
MSHIGVVLQGGGALGAYECGALTRLYEEDWFRPDTVSGVSIGAINAATLVGSKSDNPIDALTALWDRLSMQSSPFVPAPLQRMSSYFGNPSFYRPRVDYFAMPYWTSLYDVSPIRETLGDLVSFEKINASRQRLIVTATNIETGAISVFDNSDPEHPFTIEHVLASGSLPPSFPPTRIDDGYYWDGGLFDNTPLGPVIEAFPKEQSADNRLIVINLFPSHRELPTNLGEVSNRSLELIFSNKIHGDVQTTRKVNEYIEVVDAIDQALGADSPVRKLPGYRRLQQYKLVNDIIYITNRRESESGSASDFSRDTIQRRKEAGYRDADAVLTRYDAHRAESGGLYREAVG